MDVNQYGRLRKNGPGSVWAELNSFALAIEMFHECSDHTTEVMMTRCTTLKQMRQKRGTVTIHCFFCCFLGYLNKICMVTSGVCIKMIIYVPVPMCVRDSFSSVCLIQHVNHFRRHTFSDHCTFDLSGNERKIHTYAGVWEILKNNKQKHLETKSYKFYSLLKQQKKTQRQM